MILRIKHKKRKLQIVKNIELESENLTSRDRKIDNLFQNSMNKQRNVKFILPELYGAKVRIWNKKKWKK